MSFAFFLTPTTRVPALLIARHRRTGILVKRVVACEVPQALLVKAKPGSLHESDAGWISIVGAPGSSKQQPVHVRQTAIEPPTWDVIAGHDGRLQYLKLIGLASPSSQTTAPTPPAVTRLRARTAKPASPASTEPAAAATAAASAPADPASPTPAETPPAAADADETTLTATASAALVAALATPRTEDVRINLGPIDTETAIRHLRAAGLSRDDYEVSSDGTDYFVTLPATARSARRRAMQAREENAA